MEQNVYIRIFKTELGFSYSQSATRPATIYEFYFTSISKCAQWLGVSYNAVKYCLRGDYTLCEGYRMEYVKKKPDERDYFIDPDKYRNPDLWLKEGEPASAAGKKSVRKVVVPDVR
jgi:hypothetical protein